MKNLIAKLTATVTRMKRATDRMFDSYTEAINELRGTPCYVYLFEPRMMR